MFLHLLGILKGILTLKCPRNVLWPVRIPVQDMLMSWSSYIPHQHFSDKDMRSDWQHRFHISDKSYTTTCSHVSPMWTSLCPSYSHLIPTLLPIHSSSSTPGPTTTQYTELAALKSGSITDWTHTLNHLSNPLVTRNVRQHRSFSAHAVHVWIAYPWIFKFDEYITCTWWWNRMRGADLELSCWGCSCCWEDSCDLGLGGWHAGFQEDADAPGRNRIEVGDGVLGLSWMVFGPGEVNMASVDGGVHPRLAVCRDCWCRSEWDKTS